MQRYDTNGQRGFRSVLDTLPHAYERYLRGSSSLVGGRDRGSRAREDVRSRRVAQPTMTTRRTFGLRHQHLLRCWSHRIVELRDQPTVATLDDRDANP